MRLIYDLGIRLYYLLVLLASPFNPKARLWLKGRKGWVQRISAEVRPGESLTWFHCSSLGEFEQGRPVIEKIRDEFPDKKILLTFYSPSGYEIRKNYPGAEHVFYLPLDTGRNARKFLDTLHIEQAFFVKYEFWYHYLKELNSRKIPAYLISGIFRKNQVFFSWYGKWYLKILHLFDHLFVQQKSSSELLKEHGVRHTSVSGDTRFDRVHEITRNVPVDERFLSFCRNSTVIVAGSTWPEDDELIIKYINSSSKTCKWIIAPHEIHKTGINRLLEKIEAKVQLYSSLAEEDLDNTEVIIIDSIGLLSSLYQYASIAYIGGGFGKGIHNTLEAAAFSKPVLFGPDYSRFQEAKDLIAANASIAVAGFEDFQLALNRFIEDPALLKKNRRIGWKVRSVNAWSQCSNC
jgi:3-deoxy-D-manno-octulosonic-acid transferase